MSKSEQIAARLLEVNGRDAGDELSHLLASVARIADGVGAIQELAIKLAPGATPAQSPAVTREQIAALNEIEHVIAKSLQTGVSHGFVKVEDLAKVYELATYATVKP